VECGKTESEDENEEGCVDGETKIIADKKHFPQFYASSSCSIRSESDSSERSTSKQLVSIDTWSGSDQTDRPLKSPKLLRQMISEYEAGQDLPKVCTKDTYNVAEYNYEPTLTNGTSNNKTMTRCRSLLNLELKPVVDNFESEQSITKTTSELNLQQEDKTPKQKERERITKTISIMLENRRQQALQNASDKVTKEKPTQNGLFNDKLVNDNIELIERRNAHTLDRSCRVTGEILKNKTPALGHKNYHHRNACTLPRSLKSHRTQLQKHFYYPLHTARSNNHILDEELPDPDKVKNARELFERVLKIGSLENVNSLPRSPQRENWGRPTPEVRQPLEHSVVHSKLYKCYSADAQQSIHTSFKWSDNGSMSSGVGSDMSVETDDTTTKSGTSGSDRGSKENVIFTSSEEDLSTSKEVEELGKPISKDILNNIRAYGTSVTYYGGKIIASSEGYSCSPMTMTIMNEIKQSSPDYHANRRFLFDEKNLAKFRLIKSNSCGSRLELSGTEDYPHECELRKVNGYKEDCNNNETKREPETIAEEDEEEQSKKSTCRSSENHQPPNTEVREDTDSRHIVFITKKLTHYEHTRETLTKPICDMKFEEFEILEEKS
jgi:hypothetical protein